MRVSPFPRMLVPRSTIRMMTLSDPGSQSHCNLGGSDLGSEMKSPAYTYNSFNSYENGNNLKLRTPFFSLPSGKLTWQCKMGIFHCHVSLLEGTTFFLVHLLSPIFSRHFLRRNPTHLHLHRDHRCSGEAERPHRTRSPRWGCPGVWDCKRHEAPEGKMMGKPLGQ